MVTKAQSLGSVTILPDSITMATEADCCLEFETKPSSTAWVGSDWSQAKVQVRAKRLWRRKCSHLERSWLVLALSRCAASG